MEKQKKEITTNTILLIGLVTLLIIAPLSFYLGKTFAKKEQPNSIDNLENNVVNTPTEENQNDKNDAANWLLQLYFDPLVPLFDGEYGDEEKLLISFEVYKQAQFQDKMNISCSALYAEYSNATPDNTNIEHYTINMNGINGYCYDSAYVTKYETINKEAKKLFGEQYDLAKIDSTVLFSRINYLESLDGYAELECNCGGAYDSHYEITDVKIKNNELHVQINYYNVNNEVSKFTFIFLDKGNSSYILETVNKI